MARRFPKDPFSVVAKHARGVFLGYEIWVEVAPGVTQDDIRARTQAAYSVGLTQAASRGTVRAAANA